MKIAISVLEPTLESEIDPRFGRSEYFIIIDPETMQFESVTNPHIDAPGGAGISTAKLVFKKGASAVMTGSIGPKAYQALAAAGVRMWTGVSGTVREAIESLRAGKLVGDAITQADAGIRKGAGTRGGTGMGRGRGMGGGTGRGMGCGGGGGRGMGPGRGEGAGRTVPRDGDTRLRFGSVPSGGQPGELSSLRLQASQLADEISRIRKRIEQIEKQ